MTYCILVYVQNIIIWQYLVFFDINLKLQLVKLFWVEHRRCVKHNVASAVVLWECNAVAYRIETSHDRHKAVETECKTCVRRCSVLEGIDKESKLSHSALFCESKDAEHLLLKLAVVYTEASATNLDTVAYKVVCLGTYLL